MEANWLIIGSVVIGALALIIYLIKQNRKDEKDLEKNLNNDFKSPYEEESELNNEDR